MLRTLLTFAISSSLWVTLASAQEPAHSYTPASFVDGAVDVGREFSFPDGNEDVSVTVNCDAFVDYKGRHDSRACWANKENSEQFISVVIRNIPKVSIRPAQVDGKPVSVHFQHAVVFTRSNGSESIRIYPHQFFNAERYGDDYSEAQRYFQPSYGVTTLGDCGSRVTSLWVGMLIPSVGGKPEQVQISQGQGTWPTCGNQFLRQISASLYIPAFHDGKPVPSRYRVRWLRLMQQ